MAFPLSGFLPSAAQQRSPISRVRQRRCGSGHPTRADLGHATDFLRERQMSGRGRCCDLNMDGQRRVVGVEIGGTKLQIVLGTAEGGILERVRFEVDPARGAVAIRDHIEQTLGSWRGTGALASIGVGFGGPVDWRTGQVSCSHHVEGWSDFPLGEWLRERCGLPVRIDNDANVGALAESRARGRSGRNSRFLRDTWQRGGRRLGV